MNKWFVVQSLKLFAQNPKMIGFEGKHKLDGSLALDRMGNPRPVSIKVSEIKPGDMAIYYCLGDSVVKGVYEIVRSLYAKERRWPELPFQFSIKSVLELAEPYDFKPLIGSLNMFDDIVDRRKWRVKLRGIHNTIKLLTEHDYNVINNAMIASERTGFMKEDAGLPGYSKHLLLQHQIAECGLKSGFRVHVAINDKEKIKGRLSEILDNIPKFHNDDILDIAKGIDVLFFDDRRDVLTHAFEVENTPIIYPGLLRLNDIAQRYPIGKVKFVMVSDQSNSDRFHNELMRPSFARLREGGCRFVTYGEVNEEWQQLKDKKPPSF